MMEILTKSSFDSALAENSLVFIDFYADWCGPCRMMAPVIEELAKELEGKVKVAKVNVDEENEIAGRFQIFSIPTFILFKDGKEAERIIGGVGKNGLLEKINRYLKQ
jgi:thioredoxin 1